MRPATNPVLATPGPAAVLGMLTSPGRSQDDLVKRGHIRSFRVLQFCAHTDTTVSGDDVLVDNEHDALTGCVQDAVIEQDLSYPERRVRRADPASVARPWVQPNHGRFQRLLPGADTVDRTVGSEHRLQVSTLRHGYTPRDLSNNKLLSPIPLGTFSTLNLLTNLCDQATRRQGC